MRQFAKSMAYLLVLTLFVVGLTACDISDELETLLPENPDGSDDSDDSDDVDTQSPVITLNGDNPMVVEQGSVFVDPGAVAVDETDGAVSVQVVGAVDTNTLGIELLTYQAADRAGNVSQAVRTVNVVASTEQSAIEINRSSFTLVNDVDSSAADRRYLIFSNSGVTDDVVSVKSKPEWLTLSDSGGEVPAGGGRYLALSTPVCSGVSEQEGDLILEVGSTQSVIGITVSWLCQEDLPANDFDLRWSFFTQGVPANDSRPWSPGADVPLVKNRPGILAVALVEDDLYDTTQPKVVLDFITPDGITGEIELTSGNIYNAQSLSTPFSGVAIESRPDKATGWVFSPEDGQGDAVEALFFQNGTQYAITVDPDNSLQERSKENNRLPAQGYYKVTMIDPPAFEALLVPVVVNGQSPGLSDDLVDYMERAFDFMPFSDKSVAFRSQPYSLTSSTWAEAVSEIDALRLASSTPDKHFLGLIKPALVLDPNRPNVGGVAPLEGKALLSWADSIIIAHELGHSFGRLHSPCGDPSSYLDPDFPDPEGKMGVYNFMIQRWFDAYLNGGPKHYYGFTPESPDYMGYCGHAGTSAYHYQGIAEFRGERADTTALRSAAVLDVPTVLTNPVVLTGEINTDSAVISRQFEVTGLRTVVAASPYRLTLLAADGVVLYEGALNASKLDHADSVIFSVAVPAHLLKQQTAKVQVYRGDRLLLSQDWQAVAAKSAKAGNTAEQVRRLDEQRIEINWDADDELSLWVRDVLTDNILSIDRTGSVIVHTMNNQLELTYRSLTMEQVRIVDVK